MVGTQLSLKIANFPDVVAKGYLAKNVWHSDAVQVCGHRWRLNVELMPGGKRGQKEYPPTPKYIDCKLEMLVHEGILYFEIILSIFKYSHSHFNLL
jgi:hypothetical protein